MSRFLAEPEEIFPPQLKRLEDLLEDRSRAPFYDLLGGLADNLLTIGGHAGTFLSCGSCGTTFTLKGETWTCQACGEAYEVRFGPTSQRGTAFKSGATVTGLSKARANPHWYFESENLCVAEFVSQMLRLRPEVLFANWLCHLGLKIEPSSELETVLCWPRFRFGGKTIQPDLAIGLHRDIVLFEFKRPVGGRVPPTEVMGQILFASEAGKLLGRRWHIVLVPGKDSVAFRDPSHYVRTALENVEKTMGKWVVPPHIASQVMATSPDELASHFRVLGWEELIKRSKEAISASEPESWTRRRVLENLLYFQESRAALGLLSRPHGDRQQDQRPA